MKHFRVVFEPEGKEISIHRGATLLQAAGQAGIILTSPCGGAGTCGKCLVTLASGQRVRACQHTVESDLTVRVPAAARYHEHRILDHGVDLSDGVRATIIEKYRPIASSANCLGLAVDIGTTTVVAKLIDLASGRCLNTQATLNPQIRYGDDVISRISYAGEAAALSELHRAIVGCINDLIERLCKATQINSDTIYETSVVGNTTMNHLFLEFPVHQLGHAPYQAHSVEAQDVSPERLGVKMNRAGNIHTAENIAGFVGSDTLAAALAVDMESVSGLTLVVDIGTNGELVLGTGEKLYAASCAAGPALEGARIRDGARAAEGAIEAVVVDDGDIDVDVIGNTSPRSICGSGLIDAVAVLLDLGVINAAGSFLSSQEAEKRCSEAVRARLLEVDGQGAFCLAFDRERSEPRVVLTQRDVREFQLAKGAIQAGIQLLLKKTGSGPSDLQSVLLAGAFGNYIRPRSAVRVGLLPDVPLERIHFVGNAAASGAEMLLLSDECRRSAASLARRIEYVEIAHERDFSDVFAEAMLLNP